MDDQPVRTRLVAARERLRRGDVAAAVAAFEAIVQQDPGCTEAAIALARVAQRRGDATRAEAVLHAALAAAPQDEMLAVELAVCRCNGHGGIADAIDGLRAFVAATPDAPLAWLLLGQMLDDAGQATRSLVARFEAIDRARRAGSWQTPQTTPAHVRAAVGQAIGALRRHRDDLLQALVEPLRQAHGAAALARVDRALASHAGHRPATPRDAMQRPRVFYFPDLPETPFLEAALQPWAQQLRDAFPAIRAEALALLRDGHPLEDFVQVADGDDLGNYLGGLRPSWEAFFFYRHGRRYDANHARCPHTSAVLDALDLVRIPGQTPEVCFSVLTPGTHILPHHGVTNTRSVMHLPLIVPNGDCALNLVDRGTHRWRAGELVMFDDTYLHEAWNRTGSVRVIVLMDCWNPHLTAVEREATVRIAPAIGLVEKALADDEDWSDA